MKAILILSSMMLSLAAFAQRQVDASEDLSGIKEVIIICNWANVEIKNWNDNSLKVSGNVSINNGINDDAFKYDFDRSGKKIYFNSDIPTIEDLPQYVTYVIKGQEHQRLLEPGEKFDWNDISDDNEGARSYSVGVKTDIDLVIFVPPSVTVRTKLTYGDLDLADCTNALDLMSTYGHIEASFTGQLPNDCQMTSTYSFIDVTLPHSNSSQVRLQTSYGDIYTDLDVAVDKQMSVHDMYNSKIVGNLNQGGIRNLNLRSNYGNIYLRGK